LQRIEALPGEHLLHLLWNEYLSLGKLDELRLAWVLEVANGANGLIDGAASPVSWLERRGIGRLVHVEIAHVLGVVVALFGLLLRLLGLGLSPVAIEVARLASAMALATVALTAATLKVRLAALGSVVVAIIGNLRARKLEVASSATGVSAAASNRHALTTTMATPAGGAAAGCSRVGVVAARA
jgi:hypothetical protein